MMTNEQAREILCKQLELLAEAAKCCGPDDYLDITKAMVLIFREL